MNTQFQHRNIHRSPMRRVILLLVTISGITIFSLCSDPLMLFAAGQSNRAGSQMGIEGVWQGTLHLPDSALRTVVKIARTSTGQLNATLYSIDQGGRAFPMSGISFDGQELNFSIQSIDFSYEGKMAADRNSISGIAKQAGDTSLLVFERATPETEWVIPVPAPKLPPMAVDIQPGIDVATVKPTAPGALRSGMTFRGREVVVSGYTLMSLITFAYNLHEKQLVNVPGWSTTEAFDANILPNQPGVPNREQIKAVIKALLADRFALRFHEKDKDMSAYVLRLAKDGPRMIKSADTSSSPGFTVGPLGLVRARNTTMTEFTALMQANVLDRPVVDQTGLQGRWDLTLKWMPDESQFGGQLKLPPSDDTTEELPPLFSAIQEQLGLRLTSERTAVMIMIVDHVEHPTPN